MGKVLLFSFIIVFSLLVTPLQSAFAANDELGNSLNPESSLGDRSNPDPVDCKSDDQACLTNPLDSSISSIPKFFEAIINILIIFAVPFIVFFIIYAGFLYVTARGNPEAIKKAHAALLYALIGGLLILGANVLLTIITGTVGEIIKK